jgi:hypothetical protein
MGWVEDLQCSVEGLEYVSMAGNQTAMGVDGLIDF